MITKWLEAMAKADKVAASLKDALAKTDARYLTITQIHVMNLLYNKDGQHPSDLARGIGKPVTSFTPLADSLENAKLVMRQPDPDDRRAVIIKLTAAGHNLRGVIVGAIRKTEQKYSE